MFKVRKNAFKELAVGIGFLIALFSVMIVRQYYTWHMPGAADPMSGRTIAVLVNYRKIVFVNSTERAILYGAYMVLSLAAVGAITVYILARRGRDQ